MDTLHIPLTKLTAWEGNVRKTGPTEGLEELKASLAAHGLLQSLVVRKASRGKYAVIAGRRRLLALKSLAEEGSIPADLPVSCTVLAAAADATEISLAENAVRVPMHPADQFEAFRDLIDAGSPIADIAARFGVSESVVRKRLRLARVSRAILAAYRSGDLALDQVQAFAVSDDHSAQERVLASLSSWRNGPEHIREALTQDVIAATDRRVRFVTLAAYEQAGGALRRDLFSEGEEGLFLEDAALLERLMMQRLEAEAETVRAEGWQWVEAHPELDYDARSRFHRRYPEPAPLCAEDATELARLSEYYDTLCEQAYEDDEEAIAQLAALEARIEQLQERERLYPAETLAIAGAIVTVGYNGGVEILRGLVRPEDLPTNGSGNTEAGGDANPASGYSAALTESLTAQKTAALAVELARAPDRALAAVTHALALRVFAIPNGATSLQLTAMPVHRREPGPAAEALEQERQRWGDLLPGESEPLWQWCLAQDRETLLELLAFCAACTVNAVQAKADRSDCGRLRHANALAALTLDMTAWFTPTAANFFSRISRSGILAALAEAKGTPLSPSLSRLKKAELATVAERELTGTDWLPIPLRHATDDSL